MPSVQYASWPPAARGAVSSRPFFPDLSQATIRDGRPLHASWPPRPLQYNEQVLSAISDIPLRDFNAHLTSEMRALQNLHAYNTGKLSPEHVPRLYGLLAPISVEGIGCRRRMGEYLKQHVLDVAAGSRRCAACTAKLARAYCSYSPAAPADDEPSVDRASVVASITSRFSEHVQDACSTMGSSTMSDAASICASTSSVAGDDLHLLTIGLSEQGSASDLMSPDTPGAYSTGSAFPANIDISSSLEGCVTSGSDAGECAAKALEVEFYIPKDWEDLALFGIGDYELSDDE